MARDISNLQIPTPDDFAKIVQQKQEDKKQEIVNECIYNVALGLSQGVAQIPVRIQEPLMPRDVKEEIINKVKEFFKPHKWHIQYNYPTSGTENLFAIPLKE